MKNSGLVAESIEFIEENIKLNITVEELAAKIGYSSFHFSRLFHSLTGYSPKDYILKRKLSEISKKILNSENKITDIAFEYGFNDYETFCRAYKNLFKISPADHRMEKNDLKIIFYEKIDTGNILNGNYIAYKEPEIVERNKIYLVGMPVLIRKNYSLITELWSVFWEESGNIKNARHPLRVYQLMYWGSKRDINGTFFMVAIETESIDDIPFDMVGKVLPSSRYLRFIHKGISSRVGNMYEYIYGKYLPESEHKPTHPYSFEFYGKNYKGPNNPESESEIYIPVE